MPTPDVSDPEAEASPNGTAEAARVPSDAAGPSKTNFSQMSAEEVKQWVEQHAKAHTDRYAGLERALREQLIREGVLPASALWEDQRDDPTTTVQLDISETFERTFTEGALGLALNVGQRGAILVKRCVPGSPAAGRRIPPGVILTHVADVELEHLSLKQVQTMLQQAERPVKLTFRQTEASLAFAHASVRSVAHERDEHKRETAEARARFEEEMRPAELETAATFTRTYSEARLGLCLLDGSTEGARRTLVRKCLPRTPAWKSGLPPNVCITAVNGKSVQFRRFKEVKKMIELAQRPVTIAFSMEEEPSFPAETKLADAETPPAYVLRPV